MTDSGDGRPEAGSPVRLRPSPGDRGPSREHPSVSGPRRLVRPLLLLLYLSHDISFPSPTLAKVGDGAVHRDQYSWLDHAPQKAGTASLRGCESLLYPFYSLSVRILMRGPSRSHGAGRQGMAIIPAAFLVSIRSAQIRSNRPDFCSTRNDRTACPDGFRQRMPLRFMR